MDNLITVKQMADKLNVSKGTINNHMAKNKLEYEQIDNVNYLTEQHQTTIEQSVNNTKQRYQTETNNISDNQNDTDKILNILIQQLNEKDNQIKELQKLLDQSQQLEKSLHLKLFNSNHENNNIELNKSDKKNNKDNSNRDHTPVNESDYKEDTQSTNDSVEAEVYSDKVDKKKKKSFLDRLRGK